MNLRTRALTGALAVVGSLLVAAPASATSTSVTVDCAAAPTAGSGGWVAVDNFSQNPLLRVAVSPGDVVTVVMTHCNYNTNTIVGANLGLTASSTNYELSSTATLSSMGGSGYMWNTAASTLTITTPATVPFTSGGVGNQSMYIALPTGYGPERAYISFVPANESALSALQVGSFPSVATLSPTFAVGTTSYTASTSSSSVTVSATARLSSNAVSATCNGSALVLSSGQCALTVGSSNTITVTVTAPDSSSTTYTVTVTRNAVVAPVIATTTTIANGSSGASVVITGTGFSPMTAINAINWTINTGTTGLTRTSITVNSSSQVTIAFSGTAAAGTLSITAGMGAYTSAPSASNTLSITVGASVNTPAAPPVDPMAPESTPTIAKSLTAVTCSAGAYSQQASFVAFSLLVDGEAVATSMTDRSLPVWLIPHLGAVVTTDATLSSATFAWNSAWAGKKLQCAVLAYANHATGHIHTDEI